MTREVSPPRNRTLDALHASHVEDGATDVGTAVLVYAAVQPIATVVLLGLGFLVQSNEWAILLSLRGWAFALVLIVVLSGAMLIPAALLGSTAPVLMAWLGRPGRLIAVHAATGAFLGGALMTARADPGMALWTAAAVGTAAGLAAAAWLRLRSVG